MAQQLVEAAQQLGLSIETSQSGRWVRLHGQQGDVYVVSAAWGHDYYTWRDEPDAAVSPPYRDPIEALQAGLRQITY